MADADAATTPDDTTVRLQVAAARQEESGQGIARMPRSAFQALGITEGDLVEITGKRVTAAVAMAAYDEDQSLDVIRLDGLQRGNAEVGSGEHVRVAVAESRPATRVVFAPAQREMRLQGPAQALKRNFFRKPLVAGDLVATTGQQPVQNMPPEVRRMFNAPAYALTQIRLSVVSTSPKGIVHIDEDTEVELRAEFPNPDGLLLSGEFVNARIYAGKKTGVIAIPQRAVSVADSGGTVMIVDKDGKAAVRPIELGELVGDKWIVTSGLKPGDRVIVSNLQKLQPGMPVQIANAPTGQKPAAKAD